MRELLKRTGIAAGAAILMVMNFGGVALAAEAPEMEAPAGRLVFLQFKMTGSEILMLQNNIGGKIENLSQYWLYAFNNMNPLASGVSSSSQQLPEAAIEDGETVYLTKDGGRTCGAAATGDLTVSITDSTGYLQLVKSEVNDGVLSQTSQDVLSWSSGANPASGMISSAPSNTSAPHAIWYRYFDETAETFAWQRADYDADNKCQINVTVLSETVNAKQKSANLLLPGLPPPATIISTMPDSGSDEIGMAPGNIGLRAPILNEILPNPASPQTDAEDEFIELYNPNDKQFDLSGFKLQTVSSSSGSKRTYTFPKGTVMKPKSFAAYPSANISISLVNSGGQVLLLDPMENVISQTDEYGKAEDGLAWALAEGKWYWTAKPTAGNANVIEGTRAEGASGGEGVGTVQGSATSGGAAGATAGNLATTDPTQTATLHPGVLAIVAASALVYGAYEYRGDMANFYHRFVRNRIARRADRSES